MFYTLAMSDFWARMPPFGDSIFLPSVRLLGSLHLECLFLDSACFSLVLLSVVFSCRSSLLLVGCGLSGWSLPLVVGRLFVGRSLVVGRQFSLPGPSASELSRDSLPNSLPPRSPRLSSSASRATHCQPAFLLSASVDSSDKPFGVSRPRLPSVSASWLPLVGFRLWVRFARPLPLLVFEAPFSSLAFPRLLEIAWFRPVLVASPVSANLSRACPAPFPPVAWPPPRVSFFTSSAPRVRFRASFWVPSGSLRVVFLGLPPTLLRSASSPLPSPGSS